LVAAVFQLGYDLTINDRRLSSQSGPCGTHVIGNLVQRNTDHNDHPEEQQQDQQGHRYVDGQ
jgi:hypothetical protein